MSDLYFNRYAYPERFISDPIKKNTFLIAVIPVYKEDHLQLTINALLSCEKTQFPVEVIFVINHPENADIAVKEKSFDAVKQIDECNRKNRSAMSFQIIEAFDLPKKKAGVGLARKIGMDEAAYRLNSINQDGVILCFDADSQCESNYLKEIEKHFLDHTKCTGASIHYEHPLYYQDGSLNSAIILYELHLRYYIQALKYSGYPFAYHTIGSSMAVRSSVYQKQGGMNQRKAGEDFYFLHKIIPLGNFHNISSTKVMPSSRVSDRVPFGTGRAMQEYKIQSKDLSLSYDLDIFKLIKWFLENINKDNSYSLPAIVMVFLKENKLLTELEKIKAHSKNEEHFRQRFFEWFNGFKILKLVHFLRDHHFPEKSLKLQANNLLIEMDLSNQKQLTTLQLLEIYRNLDKEGASFN